MDDCETRNCTDTICTYRVIGLGLGCLVSEECLGFPANICDPNTKLCVVANGARLV